MPEPVVFSALELTGDLDLDGMVADLMREVMAAELG